jgi:amino acid adenylation domain-containing protein
MSGFEEFPPAAVEQTLAARFTTIVARHPGKVAVAGRELSLTYAELDGASSALAEELLDRGGDGEQPLALLLDQGPRFALAFLAAVKAGAIVVPLDPTHPPERQRWIVREAGCDALVCSTPHESLARTLVTDGDRVVVLTPDRLDRAALGPVSPSSPSSAVSVHYTSGSTGPPKGVVDTHRTILHNVRRYTNQLRIAPDDRLSLLQSPAFSGGLSSLLGALLNGASVHPIDFRAEGPAGLARWLETERVTIYHSVPAIFRALVAVGRPLPSIRLVRLEGDQASPADAERFKQQFRPGSVLANGLGATECGLVRQFFVDHGTEISTPTLPVGYPVPGADVLVLAGAGREAAPGEVGELVVRSSFLSPGYWRRPELTAAAFEERPDEPGVRRYRTGDLGRMAPDGCIEYLGRRDAQVKVRGERVEIEAVENALVASGLVREAAATTRARGRGEPALVAFVVPETGVEPAPDELRRKVAASLPPGSVPSEFRLVDGLPLTEHGKLDRAALGALDGRLARARPAQVEARDPLEQQLVELWRESLGVEELGVHDEFLALGGDSLAAATLLARLEQLYDLELPASLLAANGTIEALAAAIGAHARGTGEPLVHAICPPGGDGVPLFFAHGDPVGGGLYCRRLAAAVARERPFYGVSPPLPERRMPSLEELAERRVEAIERTFPSGPYLIGGGGLCIAGGMLAFEIARQLQVRGRRVDAVLLLSALPANGSRHARLAGVAARGLGTVLRLDRRRQAALVRVAKSSFSAVAFRLPAAGRRPAARRATRRCSASRTASSRAGSTAASPSTGPPKRPARSPGRPSPGGRWRGRSRSSRCRAITRRR